MSDHSGQQIVILTIICFVKVKERLAVNKQRSQISYGKVQFQEVNEVEGKEQYRVEVSNRFAALEDLDAEVGINSAWVTIRENIKISAKESPGYYELRKHKPMCRQRMLKIIRSKETGSIAVVTVSK
jgi:flagellar basal body-associated protein FliL